MPADKVVNVDGIPHVIALWNTMKFSFQRDLNHAKPSLFLPKFCIKLIGIVSY